MTDDFHVDPAPLLVFGEDWGGLPSSTQHLIRHLATDRAVLWVNSIGLRRPRFNAHDLRRASRKLCRALGPARSASSSPAEESGTPIRLSILDPLALPLPGNAVAQAFNGFVLGRQIRKALARRGLARPILWTSLPTAATLIGRLNECAVVYYCGDDFSALEGVDGAEVAAIEADLVRRADLVVTANGDLAARFPGSRTRVLPHGVDLGLFARPQPRPADLPTGKVAGFYGSLAGWIDAELIAATAERMTDWTFVLIGPQRAAMPALAKLANVRLLGPRLHADLAGYAQHWTAALLPFRDTPQIRAAEPLKLREYLAAGRPVIATAYGAATRMPTPEVRLANDPRALSEALTAAATEPAELADRRRRLVAGESWHDRAATLSGWLAGLSRRTAPQLRAVAMAVAVLSIGPLACAPNALDFIPETERALIRAQSRLEAADPKAGPTSVAAMLSRARGGEQSTGLPPAPATPASPPPSAPLPAAISFDLSGAAPLLHRANAATPFIQPSVQAPGTGHATLREVGQGSITMVLPPLPQGGVDVVPLEAALSLLDPGEGARTAAVIVAGGPSLPQAQATVGAISARLSTRLSTVAIRHDPTKPDGYVAVILQRERP